MNGGVLSNWRGRAAPERRVASGARGAEGRASDASGQSAPRRAAGVGAGALRALQPGAARAAERGDSDATPAEQGLIRWRRRLTREARSLVGAVNPRALFWTGCARLLPCFALESVRAELYRLGGCDVAGGVALQGPLSLIGKGPVAARLHIGEGTIIAPRVTFGLDGPITIGRNVNIGPGATLYTATHGLGFGSRRMQLAVLARPIVVEDGVWIGMQSLILPGVTLGRGSVVSARAVVTESVPPNSLVAGNPAAVRDTLPFGNR